MRKLLCFITTGCSSDYPHWIGDGYCDDETNIEGCNFDGGDCCGVNKNTQYCTECLCYEQTLYSCVLCWGVPI